MANAKNSKGNNHEAENQEIENKFGEPHITKTEVKELIKEAKVQLESPGIHGDDARNIKVMDGSDAGHEPEPGHQGDVVGTRFDGRPEPEGRERHQPDDIVLPGDQDMPGRKPSLNTKRGAALLQRAIKQQLGMLRRGRPTDPSSPRQQVLAKRAELRAKGELHQGRPKYTEEQRIASEKARKEREMEEAEVIQKLAAQLLQENGGEKVLEMLEIKK